MNVMTLDFENLAYLAFLTLSVVLPLALLIYIRDWERNLRVKLFILIISMSLLWSIAYIAQLVSFLPSAVFWLKTKYIAITMLPVFWFLFALEYTGKNDWLNKRFFAVIFSVPVFNLLMVWTNEIHGLFFEKFSFSEVGPFLTHNAVINSIFWFHSVFSYSLLILGVLIILWSLVRLRHIYIQQGIVLSISILLPVVANLVFLVSPSMFNYVDVTPLFFPITILAFAWNMSRFGFMDLVPISHEKVFDRIGEAILVLDQDNRVLDANKRAEVLVTENFHPPEEGELIGSDAEKIFEYSDELSSIIGADGGTRGSVEVESEGKKRTFDILKSPIRDSRGNLLGRIFIFREITELEELKENRFLHILLRQDLRSKLQLVAGYVQLSEKKLPKKYGESLRDSIGMVEESLDLITQVKRLREIRDKGLVGTHKIDKAIQSVIEDMESFFESREVELEVEEPIKSTIVVGGYPLKVLLINVLKSRIYNFECKKMRISTKEMDETFRIRIEDDGERFPEELQNILRKSSYVGETTGMGGLRVYIIKKISEKLDGEIKLGESDYGGLRFDIFLQKA